MFMVVLQLRVKHGEFIIAHSSKALNKSHNSLFYPQILGALQ